MCLIEIPFYSHQYKGNFPGADIVYSRATKIVAHLNTEAYNAQKVTARGKNFRFVPDATADSIIKAMNSGDEETLKAMNYQYRSVW